MQYVIIGNSAAGVSAAEVLRKADAECDITIVSEEEYRVYNRPLIARYMGGEIAEEKLWYRPDRFYEDKRIHLYKDTQAVRIDPKEKYIFLSNDDRLPYDRLLLATGAQPFVPPMEGLESHPNFHTFLELKDAKLVKESVSEETEAAILGAGLIGLEVAEELRHYTKQAVHVVELAPRLLPTICNTAASEILKQAMEAEGVVFHLENTVTRVEGSRLHLKDGTVLPSKAFIAAVGIRANVKLAQTAEIEINRGIVVNSRMETSASDIYAAGDVITTVDPVTGKPAAISLWSAAYAQGQCAGKNMAGQSTDYSPVPMVNDIAFFGVHVISALASNIEDPEARIYEQRWDDEYRRVAVKEGRLLGLLAISSGEKASGVTKKFRKALSEKSISQELLDDLLAVGE